MKGYYGKFVFIGFFKLILFEEGDACEFSMKQSGRRIPGDIFKIPSEYESTIVLLGILENSIVFCFICPCLVFFIMVIQKLVTKRF